MSDDDVSLVASARRGLLAAAALRCLLSGAVSDAAKAPHARAQPPPEHLRPALRLGAWLAALNVGHRVALARGSGAAAAGALAGAAAAPCLEPRDRAVVAAYAAARGIDAACRGWAAREAQPLGAGPGARASRLYALLLQLTALSQRLSLLPASRAHPHAGESLASILGMSCVAATLGIAALYDRACVPYGYEDFAGALTGPEDGAADAASCSLRTLCGAGPRPTPQHLPTDEDHRSPAPRLPASLHHAIMALRGAAATAFDAVRSSYGGFNMVSAVLGAASGPLLGSADMRPTARFAVAVYRLARAVLGAMWQTARTGAMYAAFAVLLQLSQGVANSAIHALGVTARRAGEAELPVRGRRRQLEEGEVDEEAGQAWPKPDRHAFVRLLIRAACASVAGVAVLLEEPSARLGFVLYVGPRAMQSVVLALARHIDAAPRNLVSDRACATVRRAMESAVPSSLVLGASFAALCGEYHAARGGVSGTLSGLFKWMWGPPMRAGRPKSGADGAV